MLTNRRIYIAVILVGVLVCAGVLLSSTLLNAPESARGKSPAFPLQAELNPEQALAQDLALSDPQVQSLTVGRPSEVFGVRRIGLDFPLGAEACGNNKCWQVEIYNFDEDAAVVAIVDIEAREVWAVFHQPGVHPGINKRLADLAREIAINHPEVVAELGFQPTQVDMAPVDSALRGTACEEGHLCVSPTFELDDQILWAVVDLTEERLAGIARTDRLPDAPGSSTPFFPEEGCPPPGSVDQGGWNVSYETTGTDGLRVYDATYDGVPVLTSVKLIQWNADYGSNGFVDSTGCGGGGGGFPIYPYGDTQVIDILDGQSTGVGFEIVQDFRMGNWGNTCNYRYEQHIQFFNDGRFRVVSGAFGKGCGTNALYRPIVRIDIGVAGDEGDAFARWDGMQWVQLVTEDYLVPYTEMGHGPHEFTPEGYNWLVSDQEGTGYYIEMSTGQFGDDGRGDDPFVYVTRHHADEGDSDLGALGLCCEDNHEQGPNNYVNSESVLDENIVLWYVPQMLTDVTPGAYHCWTISGEPNPETYPCWSGPMFSPFDQTVIAAFVHNGPVNVGETAVFTNTSSSAFPLDYIWDFGDGIGSSAEANPTYIYGAAGIYTVTLSAANQVLTDTTQDFVTVGLPPVAAFGYEGPALVGSPLQFNNETKGGATYSWDFGDGIGSSTEENPVYTFTDPGSYQVTLTATNQFGDDQSVGSVLIYAPVYLPLTIK
jgi:PKD repeat protein